jgi:hypothetical protein
VRAFAAAIAPALKAHVDQRGDVAGFHDVLRQVLECSLLPQSEAKSFHVSQQPTLIVPNGSQWDRNYNFPPGEFVPCPPFPDVHAKLRYSCGD